MEEVAQEIFEYSRRGRLSDLLEVVESVHPDTHVAYDGSTALLMACKNGHLDIVKLLLKYGANDSTRCDEGSSALHLASCTGNRDLVCLLLERRLEDLNSCNEDGFTPLDLAHYYNHTEVAELIRSRGGVLSMNSDPESGEVDAGPSEKWGYGVFDQ
jgi:ankyrin repeat protein